MNPGSPQLFSLRSQWLTFSLTPFWLDITTFSALTSLRETAKMPLSLLPSIRYRRKKKKKASCSYFFFSSYELILLFAKTLAETLDLTCLLVKNKVVALTVSKKGRPRRLELVAWRAGRGLRERCIMTGASHGSLTWGQLLGQTAPGHL